VVDRKIGILGGTFDPVHNGHLQLADYTIEYFGLAEILFVPSAAPPHKMKEKPASFTHRVAMLELAINGRKKFNVSAVEGTLASPSYTINTLQLFKNNSKTVIDYYFIIGIDAFLDISSWKDYRKVLEKIHFIVSARPGYDITKLDESMTALKYTKISDYWFNSVSGKKVFYMDVPISNVSSSDIREKLKKNSDVENMISNPVVEYIKRNSLYR